MGVAPNYDYERKLKKVTAICESYKRGYPIVECCKANKLSFNTFYAWIIKDASLQAIYEAAKDEIQATEAQTLAHATKWALFESIIGAQETETVTIKGQGKIKRYVDGKMQFVDDVKTIKKVTRKAPNIAAIKAAIEKLGDNFAKLLGFVNALPEGQDANEEEEIDEQEKDFLRERFAQNFKNLKDAEDKLKLLKK